MEQHSGPFADQPQAGARPRTLTWLCTASFVNQALVFPLYLTGIAVAYAMRSMPDAELQQMVVDAWSGFVQPGQQDELMAYIGMLKAHGPALMGIFALRTLARFIGTLRMWQGRSDGFHIYTSAQLLGMLLPIFVAGPRTINFLGFILALNWCYLYFIHRKTLR
ncbi:MAG: hypothetical protein KBH07_04830 [Flavobacteriales bacterium]|nr:hypothetical protein [Flavobacteriales bacterium]MBP9079869.1 hypothetical protein [Flavobacteriales bacterium]